jgi:hypothetical protein
MPHLFSIYFQTGSYLGEKLRSNIRLQWKNFGMKVRFVCQVLAEEMQMESIGSENPSQSQIGLRLRR